MLGVVSTKPGLLLGHDDTSLNEGETGYPIALSGRVPVKISTENGVIKRGDQLMLSSLPGIAMKATGTGMVVGIALEDFNEGRKYSDGYINQVNDDLGTTTPEEVEEIARKMIKERTDTEYLDNGTTVRVGQVVMFVNSSYRWLDDSMTGAINDVMEADASELRELMSETAFEEGVSYGTMATVIKAVTTLWYKVTGLESRVQILEAENAALLQRVEQIEGEVSKGSKGNVTEEPVEDPILPEEPDTESDTIPVDPAGDEGASEEEVTEPEVTVKEPDSDPEPDPESVAEEPAPEQEPEPVSESTPGV
ncbi:MAG: hypothetical protein H6782_02550 [Candidatus Nomurabacteria bacterium]|nr:MAG: hypothetical protein H6782_02550 [Candidatus Nomurabacteria bacterium]